MGTRSRFEVRGSRFEVLSSDRHNVLSALARNRRIEDDLADFLALTGEFFALFGVLGFENRRGLVVDHRRAGTAGVVFGLPIPVLRQPHDSITHELNEALLVGDRVVGLSQYWDWKAENNACCPGATIIYDKSAPIFKTEHAEEREEFARQREEIRQVVFDPAIPSKRTEHIVPIR